MSTEPPAFLLGHWNQKQHYRCQVVWDRKQDHSGRQLIVVKWRKQNPRRVAVEWYLPWNLREKLIEAMPTDGSYAEAYADCDYCKHRLACLIACDTDQVFEPR